VNNDSKDHHRGVAVVGLAPHDLGSEVEATGVAEEQVDLITAGDGTFAQNCSGSCCIEVLNPLGRKRAELLAKVRTETPVSAEA